MAKIIIEGREEELRKMQSLLKNLFSKVNKLAQFNVGDNKTVIFEAIQEPCGDLINGFTKEEIEQALSCHANKDMQCEVCPYRKIKDCYTELQTDAALMLSKL